jgi:SHS2 domain-containing protein
LGKDARRLLFHAASVRIEQRNGSFTLEAVVSGEEIDADRDRPLVDVKAVTLHRLEVILEDNLWKAVVELDVSPRLLFLNSVTVKRRSADESF